MRFKYLVILIFIVSALLGGCAKIDYGEQEQEEQTSTQNEIQTEIEENKSLYFPMSKQRHTEKLQMEDITSYSSYNALEGYEGKGYIVLENGFNAEFELKIPVPQQYRITLCVRAYDSVISLKIGEEEHGAFYVKSPDSFSLIKLDGIYLESGKKVLTLAGVRGTSYIDYIIISDIAVSETRFQVSTIPANKNASLLTASMMSYFGEVFGNNVLLAQHVTPGSNTEINTIFKNTGRYPAIRCSDLMQYSRSYMDGTPENDDIDLATEWAKQGGIVSYGWTWYSPSVKGGKSHYYAAESDFRLNEAFTVTDLSKLDISAVEALYDNGVVSSYCLELIKEIDYMAENLKRLRNEKIPVLWRPLHQASTKWYWWGNCDPDAFIWLWRLMFNRYSEYHGLDNLIWVWAAQDYNYYPGDDYVDIIGEDIYNTSDVSNLPRFFQTDIYTDKNKMVAMTECGLIPSPDLLNRDKALWLWTALYRGDFLVDYKGNLSNLFNGRERLKRAYNHELTITLDELPLLY